MNWINRFLNKRFLTLFLISVLCLLMMHWQLAATIDYEYRIKKITLISNFFACIVDATCFFFIGMLFTRYRTKGALLIAFIISFIVSFCNIIYSRFFAHYLPNTALIQISNLNDYEVIQSILTGFKIHDLYFIPLIFLFAILYLKTEAVTLKTNILRTLGILWGAMFTIVFSIILVIPMCSNTTLEWSMYEFFPVRAQYNMAPNTMLLRGGFVRRAFLCYEDFFYKELKLDNSQKKEIECEYTNFAYRVTTPTIEKNVKNVIFIVVESYLAASSDLKVDGKEITPFLNSLKSDSSVYYNGNMLCDINLGESSDGQFIYMSGLLPLNSEITVNVVKGKTIYGLPKLLVDSGRIKHSHIIVPTSPTFWEQDAMCNVYGIERLYSKYDCKTEAKGNKDLTDEQIFLMASQIDTTIQEPFFSMILTMSMHSPYDKHVEHGFTLSDATIPPEYRNYLIDCNYFDSQLRKYIKALKQKGIFDNSLIIITADHDAHPSFLGMEKGDISDYLPLYIINGGIDKTRGWTGECHQLDVYTTLLDILGIDSKWRGLGHTLLRPDYQSVSLEKAQTLSDRIIRSNYFHD